VVDVVVGEIDELGAIEDEVGPLVVEGSGVEGVSVVVDKTGVVEPKVVELFDVVVGATVVRLPKVSSVMIFTDVTTY